MQLLDPYRTTSDTSVDVLLEQRIKQIKFNLELLDDSDIERIGVAKIAHWHVRLQNLIVIKNKRDAQKIKSKR